MYRIFETVKKMYPKIKKKHLFSYALYLSHYGIVSLLPAQRKYSTAELTRLRTAWKKPAMPVAPPVES